VRAAISGIPELADLLSVEEAGIDDPELQAVVELHVRCS